jgi:hypothetical protein
MRNGGLIKTLDRARSASNEAPAHELDAVARTLKEAVDRTARSLVLGNVEAAPAGPVRGPIAEPAHGPAYQPMLKPARVHETTLSDNELPQILQHPFRGELVPVHQTADRARAQMLAPAILLGSLLAVAVLMSASLSHTGWLGSGPRPRLAEPIEPARSAMDLVAAETRPEAGSSPALAEAASAGEVDLRALLERCERLIQAGDMAGARRELERAAQAGSTGARFALAETFDPNVLAAWGLRDRVADVGLARALYEQALSSGDTRARPRIDALRGEN